jgi:cellobiose-specific phosphotransferase system component IIA
MTTRKSTASAGKAGKGKPQHKPSEQGPVKLSPAAQAETDVRAAEHYAGTHLTPALMTAAETDDEAKRKLRQVERAVDSLRAKAVHSIIALDPVQWTDTHRGYVQSFASVLATTQRRAETEHTEADQALKSAKERAGDARKVSTELTARLAVDAYRLVKVHKLWNVTTLAQVWGFSSRKRLDPYVHAGEHATKLSTSSVENIQWLIRNAKDHAGALREAVNGSGATMQTVREHVRKVAEGKATAKETEAAQAARTIAEAARAQDETPDREAAKVGYRFSQLLVLLTKTHSRVADKVAMDLSGSDVIRHVRTALAAYDRMVEQDEAQAKADRAAKAKPAKPLPTPNTVRKAAEATAS